MGKHPVVHWEIVGSDHDALKTFYEDVFGWTLTTMPGMPYSTTDPQVEGGIGGGIGEDAGEDARGCLFYISVPDTDEHLKRIEAAGGKVLVPSTVIPGVVQFAQFLDPQGNRVGIVNEEMPG
jgi:predicted enzyme related to lactoylglutathione lyase